MVVKFLDGLTCRGERDVVDFTHLLEFLENQVAAAVAVEKRRDGSVASKFCDRVGNVRSLDCDCVFDAVLEQGEHVGAAFDDDDRVAVGDSRTRGQSLVLRDILDANVLAHLREDFLGTHHAVVEARLEQFLRAVDDILALGCSNVFDLADLETGPTGTNAINRLEGGGEGCGFDFVEAGSDGEVTV